MAKRMITTDDATGNVVSQWQGGDEQDLAPVAGRTHRTLAEGNTRDYSGTRWTGTRFEARPAAPPTETLEDQLWRIETKLDALLAR